jgi:hypothetical protein
MAIGSRPLVSRRFWRHPREAPTGHEPAQLHFAARETMTRDRGTYGPLDRDRHFVVGWSADHAAGYVHDRTIGAALRPILPAISLATRTDRAARRLWVGSRWLGGRDEAHRPVATIGQEFFHTVADRTRAIAMLSTSFQALSSDLAVWQTANKDAPTATATAQWLAADVTPTLDEWREFVAHESGSWWTRLATSWETLEQWWSRLKQLRSLARAHGIVLQSVEPVPLPKTIWQRGEEGKGSEATALLGILKIGAAAVLTVMGAVGVYSVIRELRPKREHVDPETMREILHEELTSKKR